MTDDGQFMSEANLKSFVDITFCETCYDMFMSVFCSCDSGVRYKDCLNTQNLNRGSKVQWIMKTLWTYCLTNATQNGNFVHLVH